MVETGIAFGFLYCLGILVSRFLDEYDWRKIEGLLPMARHIRWVGFTA